MRPKHLALGTSLVLLALIASCSGRDMHQAPSKASVPEAAQSSPIEAARVGSSTTAGPSTPTPAGGSGLHAAITVNASAAAINVTAVRNSTAQQGPHISIPAVHQPSNNTNSSSQQQLGSSINGTAFIPGACGPRPSALGYQCSWAGPDGIVLHWSYNVSHPPINRCTSNKAVTSTEMQDLQGQVAIHVALQAASADKLHLAFTDPAGRFFPSEGLHGKAPPCGRGVDCGSIQPDVQVLHYSGPSEYSMTGRRISAAVPAASSSGSSHQLQQQMEGWAGWVSAHHDGLTGIICGSRLAHSRLMKTGAVDGDELVVTYAVNDKAAYTSGASRLGMAVINFKTGQASPARMPTGLLRVHGILMLLAFGVFLPLGLLASRHKWFFVDEQYGDLSPWWSITHMGLLVTAAAAGLAGMIVVLVILGNSGTGARNSTHQVLGLISIGLSVLLVATYGLRPLVKPVAPGQSHPLMTPLKAAGWITVLAGWTSLFLGCAVMHENWAVPLSSWLIPCILLCSLVAALAVLAELQLQVLIRAGTYNPKTCTRGNAGPSLPSAYPVCHVRTGRIAAFDEPKSLLQKLESSAHAFIRTSLGSAGKVAAGAVGAVGGGGGGGGAGGFNEGHGLNVSSGRRVSQLQREEGVCSSRGGSSPGTPGSADSLHFRGGRQSTPNGSGVAVTGFPGEWSNAFATSAGEHCC